MSSANEKDPSKTPTAIKIAAKEASKRATNGGVDPGPGDMSAEPSMMPEPVTVPRPPTDSELVVKSIKTNSRQIKTINDPVSLPKSRKSSASTKLSAGSGPATEVSSMKAINKTKSRSTGGISTAKTSAEQSGAPEGASGSTDPKGAGGSRSRSGGSVPASKATFEGSERGVTESGRQSSPATAAATTAAGSSVVTMKTATTSSVPATQADTQSGASAGGPGQEHDEEEEGEGEVETQPSPGPEPTAGPSGTAGSGSVAPLTGPVSPEVDGQPSGGVDSAPASSGGGASKMSPKTSAVSKKSSRHKTTSPSSASSASSHGSQHTHGHGHGKKKKVTKFRYHKRITVRTHGKTSPSTIMHKVNKKDHKAGITPSTIEDMDTEELMRRAGIKGNKQTHWRVRLRQTKRVTMGGKTVTQTKVAYRDSEGNNRVKTSLSPYCKKCGKKLEECKCDEK